MSLTDSAKSACRSSLCSLLRAMRITKPYTLFKNISYRPWSYLGGSLRQTLKSIRPYGKILHIYKIRPKSMKSPTQPEIPSPPSGYAPSNKRIGLQSGSSSPKKVGSKPIFFVITHCCVVAVLGKDPMCPGSPLQKHCKK